MHIHKGALLGPSGEAAPKGGHMSKNALAMAGLAAILALIAALPVARAAAADGPTPPALTQDYTPAPDVELKHPDWAENAVIYQMNVRQFTPEGTFAAAQAHLPRIKALGADIVWLMPVHPIGEKNRKGALGSPYSVRDYYGVNPEFGTTEDLKAFVDAAHALGMYVILDWVANHTAWDNPLVAAHPEWYDRDWNGDFRPTPWWDWSDIIDLDFGQPGVRAYMAAAMKYWVAEVGVDGFRCDVAGMVPVDFWEDVRAELETVKPVFMLGEWEQRDLHRRAFDATYAWSWREAITNIAQGKANVYALFGFYSHNESSYPRDSYRMTHISNHDLNSWDGTGKERFGDALDAAIVLSVVGEGIPMIYGSQEAGEPKRLAFFEKDTISWQDHPTGELYRQLFALKKANRALWNGAAGGRMVGIPNDAQEHVFSFFRGKDGDAIFAVLNLSASAQRVSFGQGPHLGRYRDAFSGARVRVDADFALDLAPWSYRVFTRNS